MESYQHRQVRKIGQNYEHSPRGRGNRGGRGARGQRTEGGRGRGDSMGPRRGNSAARYGNKNHEQAPPIRFKKGVLLMEKKEHKKEDQKQDQKEDKISKWIPADSSLHAFYQGFAVGREEDQQQGKELRKEFEFLQEGKEERLVLVEVIDDGAIEHLQYMRHDGEIRNLRYYLLPDVIGDGGSFPYRSGEIEFGDKIVLLGGKDERSGYWGPATNEFYGAVESLMNKLENGRVINFQNSTTGKVEKLEIKTAEDTVEFYYTNAKKERIPVHVIIL